MDVLNAANTVLGLLILQGSLTAYAKSTFFAEKMSFSPLRYIS